MSDNNQNYLVELFIKTLNKKHNLVFEKEKEDYFKVLFDTYLNGQGNAEQLRDYIAAGMDNPRTIDIIAQEVVEWQAKASEMKAIDQAKLKEKEAQNKKMNDYVNTKTKKAKETKETKEAKDVKEGKQVKEGKDEVEGQKKEEHGRKRHKKEERARQEGDGKGEGQEGSGQGGLKQQLSQQGRQKCKFYPFCKNTQTCEYFHPSQKVQFHRFVHVKKDDQVFSAENQSKDTKQIKQSTEDQWYGQSCLYEHEACKFKEKCLKPNCPFAHPFKKTNPIEEMMKNFMNQNNPLSRGKKKAFKPKEHAQDEPKKE